MLHSTCAPLPFPTLTCVRCSYLCPVSGTHNYGNCLETRGCANPGFRCLKRQGALFAQCLHHSTPCGALGNSSVDWICAGLPWDTPPPPPPPVPPSCYGKGTQSFGNCLETKCCTDPSFQCLKATGRLFAQCLPIITHCGLGTAYICPGRAWDQPRPPPPPPAPAPPLCPEGGTHAYGNCLERTCCKEPGFACFKKRSSLFAQCRPSATLCGLGSAWICPNAIWDTPRPPPPPAIANYGNCLEDSTCGPGFQCLKRRGKIYAQCKPQAVPCGLGTGWICPGWSWDTPLPPSPAPICPGEGTRRYGNCLETRCCTTPGFQCLKRRGALFAQCRHPDQTLCGLGTEWICEWSTWDTPSPPPPPPPPVSPLCPNGGAPGFGDCFVSRCCTAPGFRCFKRRGLLYAQCRPQDTYCGLGTNYLCPDYPWDAPPSRPSPPFTPPQIPPLPPCAPPPVQPTPSLPPPYAPPLSPPVIIVFAVSGDVIDYDAARQLVIKEVLASNAGVEQGAVHLTIVGGSVVIRAEIRVASESEAVQAVASLLDAGILSSARALHDALIGRGLTGVTVTSTPTIRNYIISPPSLSPTPISPVAPPEKSPLCSWLCCLLSAALAGTCACSTLLVGAICFCFNPQGKWRRDANAQVNLRV